MLNIITSIFLYVFLNNKENPFNKDFLNSFLYSSLNSVSFLYLANIFSNLMKYWFLSVELLLVINMRSSLISFVKFAFIFEFIISSNLSLLL
jgi:hypothetical protein